MKSARITLMIAALAAVARLVAQQPPNNQARQLLHPLFQDHAVLQRDRPIRIFGETAPGGDVTVTLGPASARARAGADGRWTVELRALPAGGPYTLTASAAAETKTASDVLVGDVFLCSGQSNMAFSQRQADGAADDARTATDGEIRHFNVPTATSLSPRQTFTGNARWVVGAPETVGSFSAACYYFARELKKTERAPIGLVTAAYGGARLRSFMSEDALRKLGSEDEDLDILDLYRTDPDAAVRRWGVRWEAWWNAARPRDGQPWRFDYDDASWNTAPAALGAWALWNGSTNPDGFIGQMWMRTSATLSEQQAAQAATTTATLDLGSVNQEDETWLNGRYVGASSFAARTRYSIPPGVLKPGLNVVVTNVYCGWRDCGIRGAAETRAIRLSDGTSVALSNSWKYQEAPKGVIGPQLPWGSVHGATLEHNGMIAPLVAFTFRGVVWYQGESDVHFGTNYYKATLPSLMSEWRRQFGTPDLPFLVVQLPGYGAAPTEPVADTWADLREAQRLAVLADEHAAMAVTVDIGDPANLHPTNKREAGRRLSIAARHLIYGERVPPSGPAVDSVTRRGANVVVAFRDVTGVLTMHSGTASGFELCGATQASCRWADARVDGSSIVLSNASQATRVRYAWGGSPVVTVYDGSGLPAGPFEMPIR